MNLTERVNEDLKQAMKARDEVKIRSLRSIKSAFLLLQTAEGQAPVTDEACLKALQKLAKQRRDSLEQFRNAGREDLALKEEEELVVLESYLPAQIDEASLRSSIVKLIEQTGAQGAKDLGKVMPLAMKDFGPVAEGKLISALVKELLG
jgi:uncharacterized protein YqeY